MTTHDLFEWPNEIHFEQRRAGGKGKGRVTKKKIGGLFLAGECWVQRKQESEQCRIVQ